uniref:ATPase, T2SS/T4P/T4SS family n=1 Tax=Vibrio cholerae TaxID=666 RepID=UPI0020169C93
FKNALRSALREDPDVILVGELRDQETISLALTAAETGHLVFGTLHTSSAAKSYLLEKSLSVDNLFVFAIIFHQYSVPEHLRPRALLWGVIGALVLRA